MYKASWLRLLYEISSLRSGYPTNSASWITSNAGAVFSLYLYPIDSIIDNDIDTTDPYQYDENGNLINYIKYIIFLFNIIN